MVVIFMMNLPIFFNHLMLFKFCNFYCHVSFFSYKDTFVISLLILAGTCLTLKTGVKTLGGRISFLPQSLPGKIIITYLIRVFDTARGSKFRVVKFLFLGQFSISSY